MAKSIGRNHIAEQAILDFWRDKVQFRFPKLTIEQKDKSSLRPRQDSEVSGKGPLDFHVYEKGKLVFGIENKTGRSSPRQMSKFQLDISDCDAIQFHSKELNIPVYIIHAQVLEVWHPPTNGFKCHGLWWTDIYQMKDNFRGIRMRRDERRGAAFFDKKAFSDIDTFADSLYSKGKLLLVEEFKKKGPVQMYEKD